MQTAISIILVLGVLVSIHELGHLILAKRAGILCREFAIGFGPKLFAFRKNETLYTIRLLPVGGYVRMAGDDPEMVEVKTGHDVGVVLNEAGEVTKIVLNHRNKYPEAHTINVQRIDMTHELFIEGYDDDEESQRYPIHPQAMLVYDHQEVQIAPYNRQFASKTLGQRFNAIFAGPLANLLLAFVIFAGLAFTVGEGVDEPFIGEVVADTPAQEAGIQEGDRVLAIENKAIESWDDMVSKIRVNPGQEITIIVDRHGEELAFNVVPDVRESPLEEGQLEGFIGIHQPVERQGFLASLASGVTEVVGLSTFIFEALFMLITGALGIDALAGPVGIIDVTGQVSQLGIAPLLKFAAFLSVNFAIMNMLPIPALDGGRLMLLGIEAVRGRPLAPEKEGLVNLVGFAFIILLMLVVTWNDIQRVFFN